MELQLQFTVQLQQTSVASEMEVHTHLAQHRRDVFEDEREIGKWRVLISHRARNRHQPRPLLQLLQADAHSGDRCSDLCVCNWLSRCKRKRGEQNALHRGSTRDREDVPSSQPTRSAAEYQRAPQTASSIRSRALLLFARFASNQQRQTVLLLQRLAVC